MLRENQLKKKLIQQQNAYGIICSIPSPAAIELIAEAGFDFVIIDMEHILINPETIENMIRVAESYQLTPLVRVANFDPKNMLRLLDGGAQGIVLPMVENAQQVKDAISACKYYPSGKRSLNAGRPGSFGKNSLIDYVTKANEQILLVAMVESVVGVENSHEIASVSGLDMLLEGAADLSQSLGHPWQVMHPDVQNALQHCRLAADSNNVPYCAIPRQQDDHSRWLAEGVRVFVLGDDRGTAFRALQTKLAAVKY